MTFPTITRTHLLKAAVTLCACIGVLGVIYTAYSLFERQKAEYQRQGYDTALLQLVEASETTRDVTITAGDKTVNFMVVPPAAPEGGE